MGGPCVTGDDVDRLVARLRRDSDTTLLNALKDQIRYQKMVLRNKGNLRLSGTIEDLTSMLRAHLEPMEICQDNFLEHQEEPESEVIPFSFQNQGQRVAVYYDNTFYVGQVTHVFSPSKAMVKYMEYNSVTGFFKWPKFDDEAETEAVYVFKWDLTVTPHSNDLRQWSVAEKAEIITAYEALK